MDAWLECEATVLADWADPLANFLFELGSTGIEFEEHGPSVTLRAYFRESDQESLARGVNSYLVALGSSAHNISIRSVATENWAESWREWFTPVCAGERIWISPPWVEHCPAGRERIVIDPGMAFGTGHHPSTLGCLELIEAALERTRVRSALDLGTGSGILAIALAKLGVPHVRAVDTDRLALQIARENVMRNGVAQSVTVEEAWALPGVAYDCIVANLYRNALCTLASEVSAHLAPQGAFICAGFLTSDAAEIASVYQSRGLSLEQQWEREGWLALLFRKLEG